MRRKPVATDGVFINCPFDIDYWPLFEVIVFTVYACGFLPRCAREEADSGDVRLDKLLRLIQECRYGIHDISRVQLDAGKLPRFNMPFELGLDMAAKRFGDDGLRAKKVLILDTEQYRYQKYLSDIAGQDIRAHHDDPDHVLRIVRDWLRSASKRSTIPGDAKIREHYVAFAQALPDMCAEAGLDRKALNYLDYAGFVEEWLRQAFR